MSSATVDAAGWSEDSQLTTSAKIAGVVVDMFAT
jgi:hypothetical protein